MDLPRDRARDAATRFRAAIESCHRDVLPISFQDFPRGSCGDAAPMLGEYLNEIGLGPWLYKVGKRSSDGHWHAWIEQNGLIVDITAGGEDA